MLWPFHMLVEKVSRSLHYLDSTVHKMLQYCFADMFLVNALQVINAPDATSDDPNYKCCIHVSTYRKVSTLCVCYSSWHYLPSLTEDDDPGTEEDLPLMFDSCDGQDAGEGNTRLAALRHALITQLLERLDQAEEVGGLRSICYLQVCYCVILKCRTNTSWH